MWRIKSLQYTPKAAASTRCDATMSLSIERLLGPPETKQQKTTFTHLAVPMPKAIGLRRSPWHGVMGIATGPRVMPGWVRTQPSRCNTCTIPDGRCRCLKAALPCLLAVDSPGGQHCFRPGGSAKGRAWEVVGPRCASTTWPPSSPGGATPAQHPAGPRRTWVDWSPRASVVQRMNKLGRRRRAAFRPRGAIPKPLSYSVPETHRDLRRSQQPKTARGGRETAAPASRPGRRTRTSPGLPETAESARLYRAKRRRS